MPVLNLEEAKTRKAPRSKNHPAVISEHVDESLAPPSAQSPSSTPPLSSAHAGLNITALRAELDSYFEIVKSFRELNTDEVLLHIAGMSGRVAEIRTQLVRTERYGATAGGQSFRTKEIDPFLELLNLQFKIFSRLLSAQTLDYEMSKGGV
jgi:hypothetical protein